MAHDEELSIERRTELDIEVEDLWALISTADGWASWLVDDADIAVAPGATGTARYDGVERSVRIDTVTGGLRVGFSWWDRDDPTTGSYVQLEIVELAGHKSQLHITERFVGATASTATSRSIAWDVRLVSLWLMLAVQSLVMA